ncbi:MAG: NUDIX domain-containing protein [Terriglobales bacterium]|jgi:ADP-ribose pyrophosphatase
MKAVWEGKHFKAYHETVEISPGKAIDFEYVWRIDGTRSIVINSTGELLLTREYRHELKDCDWRLPGGKLDSIDERIIDAASRELQEETGIVAKSWEYLWPTTPDATVRFQRHFLLATDILVGPQHLQDGERISLSWFSAAAVVRMALEGQIREEISALSLLKYIHNRNPELL